MNIFHFVDGRVLKGKTSVMTFLSDVLRLLRASPLFGGAVVLSSIVLGLGPALWLQYFAKFIDASFAARGVGTVTSDLTHSALWIAGLTFCMAVATVYDLQTKALARHIARIIVFIGIAGTFAGILTPITKGFLVFLAILALGAHTVKHRPARYAVLGVTFLLAVSAITDILFMMTRRSMTVGSMLEYAGCIVGLSLLVAYSAYHNMRHV